MMNDFTAGSAAANLFDDVSGTHTAGSDDDYLRIGEMAKIYGVTLRTLRFYEDKGMLSPKREGATRLYSQRDRTLLKLILLGRKVGFSLRDVKNMIDLYDPKGSNVRQLKVTLEKSTKQMTRLVKQKEELDEAMADLGQLIDTVRTSLTTAKG